MSEPAVSIIVPCYNGGRFLDGLFASLAAQTFRDFETIIVDDGSTEQATRQKLDALNSIVHVVHQRQRGLASARNTGFRKARAAFVLPLDCDDTLEPTFLAETVAALRHAPADVGFVFTHMRLAGLVEGLAPRHFDLFDQLFLDQLTYCMLIRKTVWEAAGGYDETLPGYADWEFNIRLGRAKFRGIEIAKPLFVYYLSPDGTLLSRDARMHGTLWRHIRQKHADLYRLAPLITLWRTTGGATPRRVSPLTASGLLGLAKLLPEAWLNTVLFRLLDISRNRKVARRELQAGQA